MPIPYQIKRLRAGSLKISSPLFSLLHHPEEVIKVFFERFGGVKEVSYSKSSGNITIRYEPSEFDLIGFINYLQTSTPELFLEDLSKEKVRVSPEKDGGDSFWFGVASLGLMLNFLPLPNPFLRGLALFSSLPVFRKAFNSLKRRKIDVHSLDASAIVLTSLSSSPFSAQLMAWLLSLGDYLEEKIERKAYSSIEALMEYRKDYAWLVVADGQAKKVRSEELKVGDVIVAYAGEKITADGEVIEGEALVNQASLTGESNPVLKKAGDKVYAGTFVEDGKLYVRVQAVGEDTVVAGIVKIIEQNIGEALGVQKRAEEFANRFVLPTMAIGLSAYALTRNLQRLSSVLIVDYHTGVHLSTPVGVLSAISQLAERGILVKSGSKLEILAKTDTFVMDKTGTLTVGHPRIMDVVGLSISEEEVLLYGASLEQRITHPVARAIVRLAEEREITLLPRLDSKYHIGLGIEGVIDGKHFLLGSTRFMQKKRIKIPQEIRELVDKFHSEGKSVLYLVQERKIVGLITFSDPLREEAKDVVRALKSRGKRVILCTGDNEGVASYIAKTLGVDQFYARVFPAEKAQIVKRLREEGRIVAFVGDGVNDSPALTSANVGISLRSGTDIAIEVADVVIGDSLWHLLDVVDVSQGLMRKLSRIYTMNAMANTVGLVGSAFGLIGPSIATLINNGSTIALATYALKKIKEV